MTTHLKTLIAVLGMFVGVLVSEKTNYGTEVATLALVLGSVQMVIYVSCLLIDKRKVKEIKTDTPRVRFSIPHMCGIFFIAIFLIILRIQFSSEKNNFVCEKACTLSATIVSSPKIKNEYQTFIVRPNQENDTYDVLVRAPLYPRFEAGEKLSLTGKVSLPNVIMPHQNNKSFDYEMYLRTQSVGSEMFYPKILSQGDVTDDISFIDSLKRLKEYFVETISLYVSSPASTLATGMLFGASTMSTEMTETFRVAGISHIVVLSGFNIAILISFVLLVCLFLPLLLRVIIASFLIIIFVLMVDGEVSIIRAMLMSFIGLAALSFGKGYMARQALLLSLIVIILYEPIHLLHDVSLHLSFLATAGIIYMSDGIKKMLHMIRSKSYQEIITTTLAAYLATLPYSMYVFGTVSIYALLTNLIVLPFVPVMMLITFLVVMFAPISHTFTLLIGYVDTLFGNFIIFIAHLVEGLPLSSVTMSVSLFGMCFLYLVLGTVYTYRVHRYEKKPRDETSPTKCDEIISGVISY